MSDLRWFICAKCPYKTLSYFKIWRHRNVLAHWKTDCVKCCGHPQSFRSIDHQGCVFVLSGDDPVTVKLCGHLCEFPQEAAEQNQESLKDAGQVSPTITEGDSAKTPDAHEFVGYSMSVPCAKCELAYSASIHHTDLEVQAAYRRGYEQAREDAAGVANKYAAANKSHAIVPLEIAHNIRALTPSSGEQEAK